MYKIVKDGAVVGITGEPTYIKMLDNGCFGLCSKNEAQGVVFDSTPYHLNGRTEMVGADTANMEEESDAVITNDHNAAAMVFVEQAEAGNINEETAIQHKGLFAMWAINTKYSAGAIRQHNGLLYKCRQEHTSQADWTPDKTPALWAVIEVAHAGTIDDPIPAARGMEYEYGLYYYDSEDENIYLCKRGKEAGTIVLHYMPHELVGQYFELAGIK